MGNIKNEVSFPNYLKYIFDVFFKWWWAVITGIASISSWIFISNDGFYVNKLSAGLYVIIILTSIFLACSVFYQGWMLYKMKTICKYSVEAFQKNNLYQTNYLIIIDSDTLLPNGTILELKRIANNVEVLIGLCEIVEKNLDGNYQGKLIFSIANQLREYAEGLYHQKDIIIKNAVHKDSIEKYAIEYSENEIKRLVK